MPIQLNHEEEAMKILLHPTRRKIAGLILAEDSPVIWSPKELAKEIGSPLPNISYHVKIMREFGVLELAKETPRRGAVEHHYGVSDEWRARLGRSMSQIGRTTSPLDAMSAVQVAIDSALVFFPKRTSPVRKALMTSKREIARAVKAQ